MYQCCICYKELYTENPRTFFCSTCYKEWQEAILSKEPWIQYCIADEQRQRRRTKRDMEKLIFLGEDYDISTESKLVRTKFKEGG